MLQIKKDFVQSSALKISLFLSVLLALSPITLKVIIRASYHVNDRYGSGADPFVWFYYLLWAGLAYFLVQVCCFTLIPSASFKSKLLIFLSSTVVWIGSFIILRLI